MPLAFIMLYDQYWHFGICIYRLVFYIHYWYIYYVLAYLFIILVFFVVLLYYLHCVFNAVNVPAVGLIKDCSAFTLLRCSSHYIYCAAFWYISCSISILACAIPQHLLYAISCICHFYWWVNRLPFAVFIVRCDMRS